MARGFKGRKHTEESKEKNRIAHVGKNLGNKNASTFPRTLEYRKKMSNSLKGRVSPMKGKKHTEETIKEMCEVRKGKKLCDENPMWKGDDVGRSQLHDWVNSRLKQDTCTDCGEILPLDLHNLSGEYHRDLSDWVLVCRRCHMVRDGRLKELIERNKKISF